MISNDGQLDRNSAVVGQFVLSFDLELGWGSLENGVWPALEAAGTYRQTRAAMKRLLAAMDDWQIPATWGVVGGMLARPTESDLAHLPPPLRDNTARALRDAAAETMDGRDLIDAIAAATAGHVFCSHTYTHARFGHPLADDAFVQQELQLFRARFPNDLPRTETLIFPLNQAGFYPQVVADGYRTYRGKSRPGPPSQVEKLMNLIRLPPVSRREQAFPGLWRETESMLFNTGRRAWKLPLVTRRALAGVRRIAGAGEVFHLWTHPSDLAGDEPLLAALLRVLHEVAKLQDQGRLVARTM